MSKGKLIKVCGECANYDWKKHRCKLGCNEGEPQEPFYSDCPLPTVDTDQICKQSEGDKEYKLCHVVVYAKVYTKTLDDYYKTRKIIEDAAKVEVAAEIFADMEVKAPFFCENQIAYEHFMDELTELKKKYTRGA